MKKIVFVTLIYFGFSLGVFAQTKIKVLHYEVPQNFAAATAIGVRGDFFVDVKVNKDGKVISTSVESVHPFLKNSLREAVVKWHFSTEKKIEEREAKIIFEFRIKNDDSRKNWGKLSKVKVKFRKPFRLIITRTIYPID